MQGEGTLAMSAYGRLRRDILTGLFEPGARLPLDALGDRYGVGLTPLREALNRLSAEELVLREGKRGFRVAPVSLADLADLAMTLCWVTEVTLRRSIAGGDDAWEEAVILAAHRLHRLDDRAPTREIGMDPEWERRHRDFHIRLIAASGAPRLNDFFTTLLDRYDRYMYLGVDAAARRPRDASAEHRAILDAVLARDADQAVTLTQTHIRRTAEIVEAAWGAGPSASASGLVPIPAAS
ncbi:MAG: GntR family transcriptional regulator [Alphaproteobacteria bacterium]|nr:GntR family transcriptional regulator [Alphaproteobacteria bacterium]